MSLMRRHPARPHGNRTTVSLPSSALGPGPSPLRAGDPDSPATHGDERLPVQRFAMFLEHLGHQGEAVANGHIGQPDQACVYCPADVHQSAEILVERDQNPALRGGASSSVRSPGSDSSPASKTS